MYLTLLVAAVSIALIVYVGYVAYQLFSIFYGEDDPSDEDGLF